MGDTKRIRLSDSAIPPPELFGSQKWGQVLLNPSSWGRRMTIYVDKSYGYSKEWMSDELKKKAHILGNEWCHLMSDKSVDELLAFAKKLGLKPEWFQDKKGFPHFDLTEKKRAQAIRKGAVEITNYEQYKPITRQVKQVSATWESEKKASEDTDQLIIEKWNHKPQLALF
jgi:hypothetical protein